MTFTSLKSSGVGRPFDTWWTVFKVLLFVFNRLRRFFGHLTAFFVSNGPAARPFRAIGG